MYIYNHSPPNIYIYISHSDYPTPKRYDQEKALREAESAKAALEERLRNDQAGMAL
jgi:hypothetical protein